MKQYLFLATAIATASLFTGCSNNEYVGDQPEAFNGTDGAIAFSMGKANTTREGEGNSKDADKLNKVFYVYGTKTLSGPYEPVVVFNNYKVSYLDDPKSPSNTNGWEYVGQSYQNKEGANVTPNYTQNQSGTPSQSIKYWDYSASSYNFYAFSAKPTDISNAYIQVKKITSGGNEYEVTVKQEASVSDLYFADKVEISKSTNSTATVSNEYGGFVTLAFRNVGSKIRMGFYETIPGYSVKIDALTIACPNSTPKSDGTSKVTVKYDSNTAENTPNQPVITIESFDSQSSLNLGGNATAATKIGEDYAHLTWTKSGDNYTPVWPQSALTSGICKVTVDYTLTSTDGSGETIKVTGATAEVPTECIKWQSNYAYTYVFKISDQTNGTTGSAGDPAGLYPITFDALVADYANGNEEFLTTVSDLSITATQNGPFADANNAVFKIDQPINVKVMYNNGDITSAIGSSKSDADKLEAAFVNSYKYDKSPEQNLTDNNVSYDQPDFANNVITLGSQTNAGYWIVKVTYNATTEGSSTEEITKYAVLKVGTETTSSTGGE